MCALEKNTVTRSVTDEGLSREKIQRIYIYNI